MSDILKKGIVWIIIILNIGLCYMFIRMTFFLKEREKLELASINRNDISEPLSLYDFLKRRTLEGNIIDYDRLTSNQRSEESIGDFLIFSIVMANKYNDSIAANDFAKQISTLKGILEEVSGNANALDSANLFINREVIIGNEKE